MLDKIRIITDATDRKNLFLLFILLLLVTFLKLSISNEHGKENFLEAVNEIRNKYSQNAQKLTAKLESINSIVSNFNSSNKKFLNKITFKNFVNDILIAYFG